MVSCNFLPPDPALCLKASVGYQKSLKVSASRLFSCPFFPHSRPKNQEYLIQQHNRTSERPPSNQGNASSLPCSDRSTDRRIPGRIPAVSLVSGHIHCSGKAGAGPTFISPSVGCSYYPMQAVPSKGYLSVIVFSLHPSFPSV